ncbi:hypothetical protein [Ruegeria sp. Alg231-54]|uniref:hypothetical protein n=1 Tax=Ruegeria sp. Alg231-54 TaxID=1922221 RepID=UPI00131F228E|nr:hypothetical protein [Ruegeria sp. Alg231-54]
MHIPKYLLSDEKRDEVNIDMMGFDPRSKAMPDLDDHLKWWVIESERFNLAPKASFRVFKAVIAQSEEMAIENLRVSDEKLDKSLMQTAIRSGRIEDEFDWEPVSTFARHLSVSSVTIQAEVADRDEVLLDMLQEHDFFLGELKDDPKMSVGGGIYDWPKT